jgi:hypothetical protein
MTEAEWLASEDASRVLQSMGRRLSVRKVRLSLCGCLRTPEVWQLLVSPASRRAVEIGEAFVEGTASSLSLSKAQKSATVASQRVSKETQAVRSAAYLASLVCFADRSLLTYLNRPTECVRLLKPKVWLFHDILGNPFRPATLCPSWLTSTVVSLAAGIYEEKAFDRMPILADALQDAGCDNEDILQHCRQTGEHVRGCWCVDLLTGRK